MPRTALLMPLYVASRCLSDMELITSDNLPPTRPGLASEVAGEHRRDGCGAKMEPILTWQSASGGSLAERGSPRGH